MVIKEILGADRLEHPTKERIGCRGIIIQENKILLGHELKYDFYIVPGGGQEHGESLEECCIRELQEETGYVVKTCEGGPLIQLDEYYDEHHYVNYYFFCEIIGTATKNLTEDEAEREFTVEWVDWSMALNIFSHYGDDTSVSEIKRRSYLRDYTALREIEETISGKKI